MMAIITMLTVAIYLLILGVRVLFWTVPKSIGIRTSNLLIVVLRDWAWFTATKWTDYEPNGAQSKNPTTHTH